MDIVTTGGEVGSYLPTAGRRNVYPGDHEHSRDAAAGNGCAVGPAVPHQRGVAIELPGNNGEPRILLIHPVVSLAEKRQFPATVDVPVRVDEGPERQEYHTEIRRRQWWNQGAGGTNGLPGGLVTGHAALPAPEDNGASPMARAMIRNEIRDGFMAVPLDGRRSGFVNRHDSFWTAGGSAATREQKSFDAERPQRESGGTERRAVALRSTWSQFYIDGFTGGRMPPNRAE